MTGCPTPENDFLKKTKIKLIKNELIKIYIF